MNEKVSIQIGNRKLAVEMEGLTPLEITALAQKVTDRINDVRAHNKNIADTSMITLLVALDLAAELNKERSAHDMTRRLLENKAESLSESLRDSLKIADPKE